ncbi:hypothetical protein C8R44DRAFT_882202 [Mycena epipterygia]|nr:hypothetical protein C8R44DRAFT_882202 [Mycena epipterygia]
MDTEIAKYKQILGESRKKCKLLQTQNLRSARSRSKALDKARIAGTKSAKNNVWSLVKGGTYTPEARAMARMLVKAGCSQEKVGAVIKYVAKNAKLEVKGTMSRRTVQRTLMEGGLAARIQLGYEMLQADGLTLSTDATSLRGENYESGFIMINKGPTHHMRLFSLTSTVAHTSEAQLANIKMQISCISELYKQSPLARRLELNFEISDFLRLLKGMNGDHAPDMKKTVRLVEGWKMEVSRIMLGYDELHKMSPDQILEVVRDIQKKNLEEVGSQEEWNKLSDKEKDILCKSSMDTLALRIGQEVFSQLSPEQKREIDVFFWAGCSMHKELNCCKAFNDGMMDYYDDNPDIEPPVLLANRDNDATIQLAEETGDSTAAVQRALKVSERGAVKLISLFGALVIIGPHARYPDVSNTRYQSHGLGGARIISYLDDHRRFMEFLKDGKVKRNHNHLKQNIVKGLNCPKTISQMVALVLFCMAVMHPFAHGVWGAGTENLNILDLGPFHASVKAHIEKLLANPDLLLSSAPDSYKVATLDGQMWSNPKAFSECIKLAPTLPDVKPLLLAGLKRALECWERFTAEFTTGRLINQSTAAELEIAFMPSTNDANEGILGMWRRFSRESPSSTIGHFTDQAMFHRNGTQDFMDVHMNTPEDHLFLRQAARKLDQSGVEQARRVELNDHRQQVKERLAAVGIKLDRAEILKMNDKELKDQLELHCTQSSPDKEIPIKARLKVKADRMAALLAALDRLDAVATASQSS